MTFARPELVWLALVLPLIAAAAVWGIATRRTRALQLLGDLPLVRRLLVGTSREPTPLAALRLGVAAAAIGMAASGPRWGLEEVEATGSSRTLVLAVDVSRSMLATDLDPDRLEAARLMLRRLLAALPGDRIGLVAFAGNGYVLSPPTVDHGALGLYVDALAPDIMSQGGSSLAAALREATALARGEEESVGGRRAAVVLTDGEAHEDRDAVMEEANRAREAGVILHVVGVGTSQGARIPIRRAPNGRPIRYLRGPDGEIVVSRLDETLLSDVASVAGGSYVRLGDAGASAALVDALRSVAADEDARERQVRPRERYAWFVALALILIAADAWAQRTPPRRSGRAGESE
ncbi:MAG: VWA domain-containing protein [Gemmatimonadota bacterium]